MLSTVEAAVLATLLAGASVLMESHHRIDTTLSDDAAVHVPLASGCQPSLNSELMVEMMTQALAAEPSPVAVSASGNDGSASCSGK
jgi:hypothetical protein